MITVRDKVTRQYPQSTAFEEKGEPKWIRTEVPLLSSRTPYRLAKPAHQWSARARDLITHVHTSPPWRRYPYLSADPGIVTGSLRHGGEPATARGRRGGRGGIGWWEWWRDGGKGGGGEEEARDQVRCIQTTELAQ